VLQPDYGSALILISLWWGFLLVSGLPLRRLMLGILVFAVCGMLLWGFGLKAYQRDRIVGLFYPERDVLGINYSTTQSKIAIGSAGFFGKGYGQGSQTQLGFLTQPADDFILAALIEEWGWGAGMFLLGIFFFLMLQILKIGMHAERNTEKFICLGTAIVFGVQFLLNTGSTTGLLPVVGVTFPFVSYGGSSLLTSLLLLAIINAIAVRSR
jgi:rod shape determining protein RodA